MPPWSLLRSAGFAVRVAEVVGRGRVACRVHGATNGTLV